MARQKRLSFKQWLKDSEIKCIHVDGYTVLYYQEQEEFASIYTGEDITKDERRERKLAQRKVKLYISGLKKLLRIANDGPGFFMQAGKSIHGNGPNNVKEYMGLLWGSVSDDELIELGSSKHKSLQVTSYVDGSITSEVI